MSSNKKNPKCVPLCYPGNYKWDKAKGELVTNGKTRGQLVVCEDALEIIRSIDGPICPIAVTGPARSGKSYIASQLIEPRSEECVFQTSANMKPQTMGIWMSTNTFKKTLSNGTEVTVIILDTEGLDAYNAHKQNDMLMFALMALMSSVLVYNSSRTVSAEDISKLSWVNELKKVFSSSGDCQEKTVLQEDEFIQFFPNFLWLLRDFTMKCTLTKAGKDVKVDLRQYLLEEVLKLEKENVLTEVKVKELNATRRALLKSFPVFDALTLPPPAQNQSLLDEMDKGKNRGSLEPAFLEGVDVFISRCATLMKPKKAWPYVGNINGYQFTKMIQQYVFGFSATKFINVHAVVKNVMTDLLQSVVEMAFADYSKAMDEYAKAALPCQNYEITVKHNSCVYKAMATFKDNSKYVNDAYSLEEYRTSLKEKMVQYSDGEITGGYLANILKENEKKSDAFCRKLINELVAENLKQGNRYSRPLSSGSKVDFLIEQYKERARGPKMWHVYKTAMADEIGNMSTNRAKEGVPVEDKDSSDSKVTVKVIVAEIEEMEKEKNMEQMLLTKKAEDKEIRALIAADIDDQTEQLETDFQERSGATQAQMETLRSTHDALVRELKLVLDRMREAKKKKQEELARKKKEVMQQS